MMCCGCTVAVAMVMAMINHGHGLYCGHGLADVTAQTLLLKFVQPIHDLSYNKSTTCWHAKSLWICVQLLICHGFVCKVVNCRFVVDLVEVVEFGL